MTRYYRFPGGGTSTVSGSVSITGGTVGISGGTVGVTGAVRPAGLTVAGRVTEVTVNQTTWTALPPSALTARNALAIQNRTGQEIKVNYSSGIVGYVGMVIDDGSERFYDITDSIVIYCKSKTSSVVVFVEELS